MACKKSELLSAINSYAAARVANDANLLNFGSQLVEACIATLEFSPEKEPDVEAEAEVEVEVEN